MNSVSWKSRHKERIWQSMVAGSSAEACSRKAKERKKCSHRSSRFVAMDKEECVIGSGGEGGGGLGRVILSVSSVSSKVCLLCLERSQCGDNVCEIFEKDAEVWMSSHDSRAEEVER